MRIRECPAWLDPPAEARKHSKGNTLEQMMLHNRQDQQNIMLSIKCQLCDQSLMRDITVIKTCERKFYVSGSGYD